ncbi:TetR/AcrR family transcriptional regulator [Frateuria defendens]|uniref:TetR/AcrR family transcriptional regulator n=1 Tax=Frateuria defendens TaxID=2219559 RepID=UPI00066FFD35|nr:TetR/AcrR family transcriptional regulator [Frateuria defendens]
MKPATRTPARPSRIRQRILDAARELFYRQGMRGVCVDAIVEAAGTNKMSFYRHFESKDALLAECLGSFHADYDAWWKATVGPHAGDARAQIEALFASHARRLGAAGSAGCVFGNAAVELREELPEARTLIVAQKASLRRRLRALAREAGAGDPAMLGDALLLLLEGASFTRMSVADPGPLKHLPQALGLLLDAALPPR